MGLRQIKMPNKPHNKTRSRLFLLIPIPTSYFRVVVLNSAKIPPKQSKPQQHNHTAIPAQNIPKNIPNQNCSTIIPPESKLLGETTPNYSAPARQHSATGENQTSTKFNSIAYSGKRAMVHY